jgi:glycerol-3-phosphate dehydrogenase (NAD(P)+)
MKESKKIAIIGAGSWGTAMANLVADTGNESHLFSRDEALVDVINSTHINTKYLDGYELNSNIICKSLSEYSPDYDFVFNAVPTQFVSEFYEKYNISLEGMKIVNCSKGIEQRRNIGLFDIFTKHLGVPEENYAVFTGPSHAEEVCKNRPTAIVVASQNPVLAESIQEATSNSFFRVYTSTDVVGTELGGAVKNVMAIAAGIIDGYSLGDNAKAGLITRGLAEISRLGTVLGGDPQTFAGLSGLGDLVVTCYSRHSRNRKVGELLSQGLSLKDISDNYNFVAEGVFTAKAINELSQEHGIEMPICEKMNEILFEGKTIQDAIQELMGRRYTRE